MPSTPPSRIAERCFAGRLFPNVVEQIAWVRERATDADLLREHLVGSGNVDPIRARRDARMWIAVLMSLQALADVDSARN